MRHITTDLDQASFGARDVVATQPWPAASRRSRAASLRAALRVIGVVAGELLVALTRSAADRADALGSGLVADGRRTGHRRP